MADIKTDDYTGALLGVLGGMGPLAAATFATRLVALTPAAVDQDHLPAVIWNDPRVPDRSKARLEGGENPLPAMIRGVRMLERAGVNLIAIPCNTAHFWFDDIVAVTSVPVLHIVDSAAAEIRRMGFGPGAKVGLMGTPATLRLRLYEDRLQALGSNVIPAAGELVKKCETAINLVKGGRVEAAWAPALECIEALAGQGVELVVLGCTELPLALPHERRRGLPVAVTDSIDALAKSAIEWITNDNRHRRAKHLAGR
jgi:aspartate racemase